ncbi:unnamed protein product [Urochloa decumbens]|uniref:Uncharacterized protein n=1 Tax=Urochloa decumbens TaxID=240449 RepID=A0ABC8VYL6_9POAL
MWSTVVLLGGFVTVLQKKDFWCLTVISMTQEARIFNDLADQLAPNVVSMLVGNIVIIFGIMCENVRSFARALRRRPTAATTWCMLPLLLWEGIIILPFQGMCYVIACLYGYSGPFVCIALALWRIAQRDYYGGSGDASSSNSGNLLPALDMFYSLVLLQGGLYVLWASWYFDDGVAGSLRAYRRRISLPDEGWCRDYLARYLSDTHARCWREPASIRGRTLCHFALDSLDSRSWEDMLSGVRWLDAIVMQGQDMRPQLFPFRLWIQRLIDALGWRQPADRASIRDMMREAAARIVAHLAPDIHLAQFPGAMECISFLLLQEETTRTNEMILQCLAILEGLALDHHNCRDICSTPGLLRKIMAPLSCANLINDISNNTEWARVGGMQGDGRGSFQQGQGWGTRLQGASGGGFHGGQQWNAPGPSLPQQFPTFGVQQPVAQQGFPQQDFNSGYGTGRGGQRQRGRGHDRGRGRHNPGRGYAGRGAPIASEDGSRLPQQPPAFGQFVDGRPSSVNQMMQGATAPTQAGPSSNTVATNSVCPVPDRPEVQQGDGKEETVQENKESKLTGEKRKKKKGKGSREDQQRLRREIFSNKQSMSNLECILSHGAEASGLEELQMGAMEILTKLALDPSINLAKETKENLIKKQLQIFLADGEGVLKPLKEMAGGTLVLLSTNIESNSALIMTVQNDVSGRLTGILDAKNTTTYRTIAAQILENLCAHSDLDKQWVKETLLPKVLTEILSRKRVAPENGVSPPRNNEENHNIMSTQQDDIEIQETSSTADQNKSSDGGSAITSKLMREAFLSLALVIRDKLITAEDFDDAVQKEGLGPGSFVAKMKTIVEENCQETVESLRIVKLCGRIVEPMMQRDLYAQHFRNTEFVRSLSKATTIMSNLESCMLFAETDFGPRNTVRPTLSVLKNRALHLTAEDHRPLLSDIKKRAVHLVG